MTDLLVSNIERFAIKDGPGIRTVVFLQGCPLVCPWCANPETRPHVGYASVKMSVDEVLSVVMRDEDYYRNSGGGLTVSGGEAFAQRGALKTLLEKASGLGLHTAVETSGQAAHGAVLECLPFVDLWLFDVKHTDPEKLKAFTGADASTVFANLEAVALRDPSKVVLRLPCIPGFNLCDEHFESVFTLAERLGIKRLDLLPYHTLGVAKYDKLGMRYQYDGSRSLDPAVLKPYIEKGQDRGLDMKLFNA